MKGNSQIFKVSDLFEPGYDLRSFRTVLGRHFSPY
jgi:hypothetical protein